MDWLFAFGCFPPRLSTTQLPSATDSQLSDGDFHPAVGAHSQGTREPACGEEATPVRAVQRSASAGVTGPFIKLAGEKTMALGLRPDARGHEAFPLGRAGTCRPM
jgi:hypothetical protein